MNFDGGTIRYNVEVNTDALDQLNKEFQHYSDTFDKLFSSALIDEKDIKKALELSDNFEALAKVLKESEEGSVEYEYALKEANKTMDEFAKLLGETRVSAEATVQPMNNLGDAIARLAGDAGMAALKGAAVGTTTALVSLAKKGISATNFLETSQTAMSGLLGSMQAGQKAMGVAADFWSNNPFNRFDVTNATKQLVQYGRQVGQLGDDLKILGNVSLSTGMSIDQLALYYGRVASSGRAMTRDVEMMSQRGVPIYREIGKIMGATTEEVRKFASEGKISFEIFKQAMEGAVNPEAMEQYEKTLDRAKDKLSGSLTTLAGALAGYKIENSEVIIQSEGLYRSWVKLLRAIAGDSSEGTGLRNPKLLEGLKKIGDAIAKVIDKIAENIDPILNVVSNIANFIGDHSATLIPIMMMALNVVTRLLGSVPILGTIFGGIHGKIAGIVGVVKELLKTKPQFSLFLGLIALVGTSLVNLISTDEEFRQTLQELFTSLGNIVKSILPIIQTLVGAFLSLANSSVIQGGIKLIVGVIAKLADLLASIPTEVLLTIVSAILAIKIGSIQPWLLWVTAIGLVIDILKDLAPQFMEAAHNAIVGFVNGLIEGVGKVVEAIKKVASAALNAIKTFLGIHSPSTVMEGIGLNMGLGLAEGIEASSSIVNTAMDNLAKDILSQANKIIGNRKDFGLIDLNGVYKDWKKVANLFTIGSEQYQSALEKMEEARKNVNLEIIKLQQEYNNKLDDSISKIKSFYNLFDEVSTKGGKSAQQIIKNLDKQVAQTAEWAEAQKIISGLGLDPRFIKELQEMGVSSVSELSSIANMTTSELEQMNDLWLKQQDLATTEATRQLTDYKNETLNTISELADGIDGETVKVEEVGGRLVASIGEGVVGAIPTLESAFSQLGAYIAEASRKATGTGNGTGDTEPVDPTQNLSDILGLGNIQETAKKWVSDKLPILIGIIGGGLALKLIPGIASALKGGSILGGLKGLFGGAGSGMAVGSHVDLSGLNNTTSALTKTAGGMSKLDKVYGAIAKGAAIIALIAIDIVLVAKAIKTMTDTLKDVKWDKFLSSIGMVAVAVVAMGALDAIAGIKVIAQAIAIGGALMLEIAIDIVAISEAIAVMNNAIPDDTAKIGKKIAIMAQAILSFEGLNVIAGISALLQGLGIMAILGICEEITQVANALYSVYTTVPDDIVGVEDKVNFVKKQIEAISEANLGQVINAIVTSWSVEPVKKIASMYIEVAKTLNSIQGYEFKDSELARNLKMIESAIIAVTDNFGIIENMLSAAATHFEADTVQAATRILKCYGEVVDAIQRIGELKIGYNFGQNLEDLITIVKVLIVKLEFIKNSSPVTEAAQAVEAITSVVNNFDEIFKALDGLGNKIISEESLKQAYNALFVVVDFVGVMSNWQLTGGQKDAIKNAEEAVGYTASITWRLNQCLDAMAGLRDKNVPDFLKGNPIESQSGLIWDMFNALNNLTSAIPYGLKDDAKRAEEGVAYASSILWKLNEMMDGFKWISEKALPDGLKEHIINIRNILWEISQVNTEGAGDLSTKEQVVAGAITLAGKFKEFVEAITGINTEGIGDMGKITEAVNTVYGGISTALSEKVEDMKQLGQKLGNSLNEGILSVKDAIYNTGVALQSALWKAIQDRFEDEYHQGRALGERFRQGLYDIDYGNAGWWAVQGFINGANNRAYAGDGVYHTGWWIANNFLQGLKNRGEQGSPWKTTMESGKWAVEGLIEGMESMESQVINEAETLADGIVNALDLSDTTISPTLNATSLSPTSGLDEEYMVSGGRGITINQNNTNYTEYDYEQSIRDLSYVLSTI